MNINLIVMIVVCLVACSFSFTLTKITPRNSPLIEQFKTSNQRAMHIDGWWRKSIVNSGLQHLVYYAQDRHLSLYILENSQGMRTIPHGLRGLPPTWPVVLHHPSRFVKHRPPDCMGFTPTIPLDWTIELKSHKIDALQDFSIWVQ